ncbi:MAG: site-specific DNA-methyltransferase [Burkholderiales bacterium]
MATTKATADGLYPVILQCVPSDGSAIGNQSLEAAVKIAARAAKIPFAASVFEGARQQLITRGILLRGKGRGGSVRLAEGVDTAALTDESAFALDVQAIPESDGESSARRAAPAGKAKGRSSAPPTDEAQIVSYRHSQKRKNNPEVGMVNAASDPDQPKTTWAYDPHLAPELEFDVRRAGVEKLIDNALASKDAKVMQSALEELRRLGEPFLTWAGKAERTSFDVDTVSLYVHERIDPASILAAVAKRVKSAKSGGPAGQLGLFSAPFETLPLRHAIDFYRHEKGWANRLIAGDSLLVMNSLIQKESMAGQVQMIYIDPPYGIKYGSNFQPFVGNRDVKDRKDEDLTQEPEMIKAFRDTWELGEHSYLTYLRDRFLVAKDLLHVSGSIFVQIGDDNVHRVRAIMDEVFGQDNCVAQITIEKTSSQTQDYLSPVTDYLLWFARSKGDLKFRAMWDPKDSSQAGFAEYSRLMLPDLSRRPMTSDETGDPDRIPSGARIYRQDNLTSQSVGREKGEGAASWFPVSVFGAEYRPSITNRWKTNEEGMKRLMRAGRLEPRGSSLSYVRFIDDFQAVGINNIWSDVKFSSRSEDKTYIVQTSLRTIQRCMLMTTDPGDLVVDPTCGSGTTAVVAEQWGRRWITCDTSRVAITLAKQRLLTASFDYYELRYPQEGLRGGFVYKVIPHVTLKSIANNPEIDEIYTRMYPAVDSALQELNLALKKPVPALQFLVTDGARAGRELSLGEPGIHELHGQKVKAGELMLWEVPPSFPDEWPKTAEVAFRSLQSARQAMQRAIDSCINVHADGEQLFDQPERAKDKLRISGPFTVEAVPFPTVTSLEEAEQPAEADAAVARAGDSARHHHWIAELLKTGIRGRGGQMLKLAALETIPGLTHVHCIGTVAESGDPVAVSFGPEYAALEQRQVELAILEAQAIVPRPKILIYCAFTFDPEAAKDIDEMRWPGVTLLKAQMNTDLLTEDLKKGRSSNQSFWLMGQPDVEVRKRADGNYEVEVHGFDYFDTVKGELISGGKGKIAAWLLDTDYDDRSLFPHQAFFPMAGAKDGWAKLRKDIRAELDEAALAKYHGTVSLPFEAGDNRKVAVKIIDDRGIESLKIIPLK